jgi:hypothetical protein
MQCLTGHKNTQGCIKSLCDNSRTDPQKFSARNVASSKHKDLATESRQRAGQNLTMCSELCASLVLLRPVSQEQQ